MSILNIYYYRNTYIVTETVSKPLSLKLKPFRNLVLLNETVSKPLYLNLKPCRNLQIGFHSHHYT